MKPNLLIFIMVLFISNLCISQHFNIYTKDTTASGDTLWNQIDEYGNKQGFWKKHNENGNLKYVGYFQNDKPKHQLKRYYENGSLKAIFVFYDEHRAFSKIFYRNGKIAADGYYLDRVKDSVWNYYSYYKQSLSAVEYYKNGKKHGRFKYYYENGHLSQIMDWEHDIRNGVWEQYFDDGKTMVKATFLNNKRHGKFIVYIPSGKIEMVGFYNHGKRHGTWQYFNEKGKKTLELVYEQGRLQNKADLTDLQQAIFEEMDENIGKIKEPSESMYPQ